MLRGKLNGVNIVGGIFLRIFKEFVTIRFSSLP